MSPDSDAAPKEVVQQQTDAYNDGDIEAFTACYAKNAQIQRIGGGTTIAEGQEEIHDEYGELFEAIPDLTCEVTDEFTVGQYVACMETVFGIEEPMDALAVYLVQNGLIHRLWLAGE